VFPEKDLARLKKEQLLTIKQEQSEPFGMALRILPKIIYGEGHAYSNPFSGYHKLALKSIERQPPHVLTNRIARILYTSKS